MILNTGTFIKADEVKNGDIVTIKNSGEVRESQQYKIKLKDGREVPKKDYVFKIDFNGSEKNISMNKISRDNLAVSFGADTENWVGKKASIEKCLFPNGKRGIVLTPIVELKEAQHDEDAPTEDMPF